LAAQQELAARPLNFPCNWYLPRYAAVDIGSNSICMAAEVVPGPHCDPPSPYSGFFDVVKVGAPVARGRRSPLSS
jgi:hypothetical protein